MKKLILLFLSAFALNSFANTCTIGLHTGPGGSLDTIMRTLQKQNKDIQLEYYPGQYSGVAVSKLKQNPEIGMFSNATMFSSKAPIKDPNVELQSITVMMELGIFSAKHSSVEDVLKLKKVNIGVPVLGGPAHFTALEIKEMNPTVEIIAFGGDVKAIPSIVNGEIDLYVTGGNAAEQFNSLNIKTLSLGQEAKIAGKKIKTYTWIGIWVSKSATPEQKENIAKCISKAITPEVVNDLNSKNLKTVNITDSRKDVYLKEFITTSEKHGL